MSGDPMPLWFQFRCRRCGSLDEVCGNSDDLKRDASYPSARRWHQCLDGGTGVAEFVGFRPVVPAQEGGPGTETTIYRIPPSMQPPLE